MQIQWSYSLDQTLRRCHRQFWFKHIFASHRAKWGSARREAFILSNVQTLETWRGLLIHSVIDDFLLRDLMFGRTPTLAELEDFTLERARKQLEFSANRDYRETDMTKTQAGDAYAIIWEDEFDFPASKLSKEEALQECREALANLLHLTEILDDISANWYAAEATVQVDDYMEFPVGGRIDLMMVSGKPNNTLRLIDWKLDREQRFDYAPQLEFYAHLLNFTDRYRDSTYRYQRIPVTASSLPRSLTEINLLYGEVINHHWNEQIERKTETRVFEGIRKIKAILDGQDPTKIRGEQLRVTKNSNNCDYCPFRQLCQAL